MIEHELKFGMMRNGRFESQISRKKYFKILNLPIFDKRIEKANDVVIINGNRRFKDGKIEKKTKISSRMIDGVKYTISREENLGMGEASTKGIRRERRRISKYSTEFPNWRFDFTIVKQDGSDEFYQVETEWITNDNEPNNNELKRIIERINSVDIIIRIEKIVGHDIRLMHTFMSQVISMTPNDISKLEGNYAVSEKADGERFLIWIDTNGCYSIDKAMNIKRIERLGKGGDNKILVDSEKVGDKYYLFDCLIWNGNDIRKDGFKERYEQLSKIEGWSVKKFCFVDVRKCAKQMWNNREQYPYELDGLIFTPLGVDYNQSSIKWKPAEMQTVDFMIWRRGVIWDLYVVMNSNQARREGKKISSFANRGKHVAVKFSEAKFSGSKYKNGLIVEFKCVNGKWKPFRMRTDKTRQMLQAIKDGDFLGPNSWRTATSVVEGIKNPIREDVLFDNKIKDNKNYYTGKNEGKTTGMRKFHNWVKLELYRQFIGNRVLEYAGGRGGDIRKLMTLGAKELVLLDIASNGLIEAERRYKELDGNMKATFIKANGRSNIRNLVKGKFDLISIMFAFHYFVNSDAVFKNLHDLCRKGGYVMITCFDKDLVEEMNTNAFRIKFDKDTKIMVYAETIGEHEEYLVDFKWLVEQMSGFKVVFDKRFRDFVGWKGHMGNDEKKFSWMNRAIVFQRE